MVHPFLQVQNMTGKLRFEVNDNQGCFIFPETWFGSLLDEFEELIDAYDADEISETSYINKLRRLARQENDFIDVHAHLAYVFLEQNAPRKALNAALKGLAIGNRLIPEGFSGRIIWIHPDNRPFLRALYAAILANAHLRRHQDAIMLIEKYWITIPKIIMVHAGYWDRNCYALALMNRHAIYCRNMQMNFHLTGMNSAFCIFLMGNW